MGPARIWKRGERVAITYLGRTVTGRVELASENGQALELAFQALLGGFAGHMAVLWKPELGQFHDIILGIAVELADAQPKDGRVCV